MNLTKKTKNLCIALFAVLLLSTVMWGLSFEKKIDVPAVTATVANGNCDGNHTGSAGLTVLSISSGSDYHLADNITATSNFTIASDITVNLCLNGKLLDMGAYYVNVASGGALNIYDCSTSQTGKITGTSPNNGIIYLNGGSLNLYGGTVESTGTTQRNHAIYNQRAGSISVVGGRVSSLGAYAIYNNAAGAVTISGNASIGAASATTKNGVRMNGGKFAMTGGAIYANNYTIYNESSGAIDISGGAVSSKGNIAIYNYSAGAVNISGGTIESTANSAIYNFGSGVTTVSGGTISSSNMYAIYNNTAGAVTISGNASLGTTGLKTNRGVLMNGGKFAMTGGAIYAINDAISSDGVGAIDVSGGMVSSENSNAIYNEVAGNVTISGNANLGAVSATTRNGVRMGGGKFTMTGGAIYATSYAIYNGGAGAIDISGGTLSSKINHTIWNSGAGAVNISGSAVSVVSSANKYAIYNPGAGVIYLSGNPNVAGGYDGAIYIAMANTLVANDGNTSSPTYYTGNAIAIRYNSTYSEVPTTCVGDIIVSGVNSSNYAKFTLVNMVAGYSLKYDEGAKALKYGYRQSHICNGITFDNELSAFTEPLSAGNYFLTDNITATSVLTIASNTTVNLCLNGKLLDMAAYYVNVTNGATLNIYDCSSPSVGTINGATPNKGIIYLNGGSLNLYGGTIAYTGVENAYTICNVGVGAITVSGGSVSSASTFAIFNNSVGAVTISDSAKIGTSAAPTYHGVYMNGGKFAMTGGAIYATLYAVYNYGEGTIDVSGGALSSVDDNTIYNRTIGDITVSGGTVKSENSHTIYNSSAGAVNISGGIVSSPNNYAYAISNYGAGAITISGNANIGTQASLTNNGVRMSNGGAFTMTGGTICAKSYALYIAKIGTVDISGGMISSTHANTIYNYGASSINISGGTVHTETYDAIYNFNAGAIDISGGTVSSASEYAIYNYGAGEIHINGGTVSSATDYAICNKSTGKIYLSGAPSVTGGTNGAIYILNKNMLVANDGNTSSPTYYTGSTVTIRYNSEYSSVPDTCKNDIIVSGVNDTNYAKFTLTNAGAGYSLKYDKVNGDLVYNSNAYGVTHTLFNITATGDNIAPSGEQYITTLIAATGYSLPTEITVTIGGMTAIKGADYTYVNGAITIYGAKVTGAIIITASGVVNEYTITFSSAYGNPVEKITQNYNTNVVAPTDPTETGFSFGGWYTDDNTFLNSYTFSAMPAENITLYAKWSIANFTLTVTGDNTTNTSGNLTATYDGLTHVLIPSLSITSDKINYSYQWKKNGSTVGNTFSYKDSETSQLTLTVTATSGALTKSQSLVFTLTVNKASYDMTNVHFNAESKEYNGKTQSILATNLPNGVTATYSVGRKDVGTTTITATFTITNANYNIPAPITADLTITQKALTITAEAKTQVYGEPAVFLNYTLNGDLFSGDTFSGSLSREVGDDVGIYAINSTLANSNYKLKFITANYTITKAPITVTIADQKSAEGGELVNFATAKNAWRITNGTLVIGDDLLITLSTTADKDTLATTIINGTSANTNYQVTFVPGNYTVYSIADFNQFIASYGATINLTPSEITFTQINEINAMVAAYLEMDENNKSQFKDAQKEKIAALKTKADDIITAKTEAETALTALKVVTAAEIRENNPTYIDAEALIKTATDKIATYKSLSSGLTETDLADYSSLASARLELKYAKEYFEFQKIYSDLFVKDAALLKYSETDAVKLLNDAFIKLSDGAKSVLTKTEKDNIKALKDKADALIAKKATADSALKALKDALSIGADKEKIIELSKIAKDNVGAFIAENGTEAELTDFNALANAVDKISEYEMQEILDKIKNELGSLENFTPDFIGDMDIPNLESTIDKVEQTIDKIDKSSDKTKDELKNKRDELLNIKDNLTQKLNLEKVKVVAIEKLTAEREKLLTSSAYSNSAKKEIAKCYNSAIDDITRATTAEIVADRQEACVIEMNLVEELHVGWLVVDIILTILLLAEIIFLLWRKFFKNRGKNSVKTYSISPLGLLATIYGAGFATGVVFFILLLIVVLALGVWIADRVLRDKTGKSVFSPVTDKIDKLITKAFPKQTPQAQELQALTTEEPLREEQKKAIPETIIKSKPSKQAENEKDCTVSKVVEFLDKKILIQYNFSFQAKLIQSPIEIQTRFGALTDELNAYSGLKCSLSWRHARYHIGRKVVAFLLFRGKTLCVALALDPKKYADTKYRGKDISSVKRFQDTPMLIRLISDRKTRYSAELIREMLTAYGIGQNEVLDSEFSLSYESTEELVKKGLVKILSSEEITDNAQTIQANVSKLIREKITLREAQSIITDEVAAALVETRGAKNFSQKVAKAVSRGKRGIVNIDTLSEMFSSEEIVNISSLKEKKLIEPSVTFVKILARGALEKPLSVEAQDFSIDAVKMILLTGGKAVKTF